MYLLTSFGSSWYCRPAAPDIRCGCQRDSRATLTINSFLVRCLRSLPVSWRMSSTILLNCTAILEESSPNHGGPSKCSDGIRDVADVADGGLRLLGRSRKRVPLHHADNTTAAAVMERRSAKAVSASRRPSWYVINSPPRTLPDVDIAL